LVETGRVDSVEIILMLACLAIYVLLAFLFLIFIRIADKPTPPRDEE
jgi:hypothetical protein